MLRLRLEIVLIILGRNVRKKNTFNLFRNCIASSNRLILSRASLRFIGNYIFLFLHPRYLEINQCTSLLYSL